MALPPKFIWMQYAEILKNAVRKIKIFQTWDFVLI